MVDIARSHSDEKIVESLKKLRPGLNLADGRLRDIEVSEPRRGQRTVTVRVQFALEKHEFDQVLDDSLEEPTDKRTAFVL